MPCSRFALEARQLPCPDLLLQMFCSTYKPPPVLAAILQHPCGWMNLSEPGPPAAAQNPQGLQTVVAQRPKPKKPLYAPGAGSRGGLHPQAPPAGSQQPGRAPQTAAAQPVLSLQQRPAADPAAASQPLQLEVHAHAPATAHQLAPTAADAQRYQAAPAAARTLPSVASAAANSAAPHMPGVAPAAQQSANCAAVPGLIGAPRVPGLPAQCAVVAPQQDEPIHACDTAGPGDTQNNENIPAKQANNQGYQPLVSVEDSKYFAKNQRPPTWPHHTGFIHPEKTAHLASEYKLSELHFEMYDLMLHLTPTNEFLDWVEVLLRKVRCASSAVVQASCDAPGAMALAVGVRVCGLGFIVSQVRSSGIAQLFWISLPCLVETCVPCSSLICGSEFSFHLVHLFIWHPA